MTQLSLSSQQSSPSTRKALWWALGLVFLGAVFNLWSLYGGGAFDLSDDESHYFLWSQHLDLCYYSKGPGIALVHWAATQVAGLLGFGPSAAVLRTAAVVFSVISGCMSIALARRIFNSNRASLMTTVLSAAVPMFAVGAVIITIDAPMYMFWSLSVYALWRLIEDGKKRWLYASALAAAVGILCKPIPVFVPICAAIACLFDAGIRRRFKTWHVVGGLLVMASSQIPFIIWNSTHDWVTFRHIGGQGGISGHEPKSNIAQAFARVGEFVGLQAGATGGLMFIFILTAVIVALTTIRRTRKSTDRPLRWPGLIVPAAPGGLVFLLSFSLPIWLFYMLLGFRVKTQVNWPAASYFCGMVLLGGVAAHAWGLRQGTGERGQGSGEKRETEEDLLLAWRRKSWRVMLVLTVLWGLMLNAFANNAQYLYPYVAKKAFKADGVTPTAWHPRRWDLSQRLRGLEQRAIKVSEVAAQIRRQTGQEPLIAATRWDLASSLSFYLPGRPFVFSVMSTIGGRHSQYDLWPGLNQADDSGKLKFAGRDILIVGEMSAGQVDLLRSAFERIDPPEVLPIMVQGLRLRDVTVWRCYGFRGLPKDAANSDY